MDGISGRFDSLFQQQFKLFTVCLCQVGWQPLHQQLTHLE